MKKGKHSTASLRGSRRKSVAAKCPPEDGYRDVRGARMPLVGVQRELRREIAMYQRSYEEVDGIVRDKGALRTMAALRTAIEVIKASGAANDELKHRRE